MQVRAERLEAALREMVRRDIGCACGCVEIATAALAEGTK